MTTKDASTKFGLTEREIREMCHSSHDLIPGAKKEGRKWKIPDNTQFLCSPKSLRPFLFQLMYCSMYS